MTVVKIRKLGPIYFIETQYGKKEKRDYTVEDNLGNSFVVSSFIRKSDPSVEVGEEVLMELQTQGKYINCVKIEKFSPVEIPPPPTEEEKVDWDGKEKRDYKGRCVMYALETLKLSNTRFEQMDEEEIATLVKMRAIDYFDWIYLKEQ